MFDPEQLNVIQKNHKVHSTPSESVSQAHKLFHIEKIAILGTSFHDMLRLWSYKLLLPERQT